MRQDIPGIGSHDSIMQFGMGQDPIELPTEKGAKEGEASHGHETDLSQK